MTLRFSKALPGQRNQQSFWSTVVSWTAQVGRCIQEPEEGRLQRQHRSEPDDIAGRRRCGDQARACRAGRARDSGRPLVRWSGDHRSRQRSEGRGARVYHRVRSGQGRVGRLTDQGSAAGRAGTADTAATGWLSVARQGEVLRRRSRAT